MPLKFRPVLIADERYESAAVFDVNNDGVLDIVSGGWWYEGPTFTKKHPIGEIKVFGEYYDDFCNIPLDINGNGYTDFVTGGWWSKTLRWRENPRDAGKEWPEHLIAETGNLETARGWDVDGDGELEIVPNLPGEPLLAFKLIRDAQGRGTGQFARHVLWPNKQGHGLGCGDIAGQGRADIALAHGWLEAPADPYGSEWAYHPYGLDLGSASVPILVADVNGDGVNDLIVGGGHRYGLEWYEQQRDTAGAITWRKHPIDPFNSQYHDLLWVDLDGDGQPELVTGKRYRAHNDRDPGAFDDYGLYYFKWTGESFAKQVIAYGAARTGGKGCGIHFAVADLRGSGRLDVVAPGKDGLFVFYNEGL